MEKREGQRREIEQAADRKRDAKEVLAEVNEDLGRLSVINSDMTTALAATNQPLDAKIFRENAIEVKTRSTRLRTDLALPLDEKANRPDPLKGVDNQAIQTVAAVLNKLLDSFLHNPVFRDQGAIDMELAAKARLDLEDIIIVSEKMRKTAEKLSKSSSKN